MLRLPPRIASKVAQMMKQTPQKERKSVNVHCCVLHRVLSSIAASICATLSAFPEPAPLTLHGDTPIGCAEQGP